VRKKIVMAVALGAAVLVAVGLFAVPGLANGAHDGDHDAGARLSGYQEVPANSTAGHGTFKATVDSQNQSITYTLDYADLEGTPSQAHIHFGQILVDGGVIAFLCGGGGKPACPATGSVSGTIVPSDVIGPAGQGIAAGEFQEVLRALKFGLTYVNVHTAKFPDGEIRGQIHGHDNHDRP
jgi:hypothetical protein